MLCQHVLILLPLIVAAVELISPFFPLAGHRICLVLLGAVFLIVPKKRGLGNWRNVLASALLSGGGAVATYLLANSLSLGPLIASAAVGLAAAVFLAEQQQLVVYLGTFVGMTSTLHFPSIILVAAAGLIGGVLWEVLNEAWNGVGGRLGTLAATAVLAILLTFGGGL